MLENIRIILVEPSHPGNIGAVARAMKNMGLSRLYLVKPKKFPDPEATWRSAHASDILENATIVDSFDAAISDCKILFGASARMRIMQKTIMTANEAAEKIASETNQEIGVAFGRESKGLFNDELLKCQYQIFIPATEKYSSLNLAQAVQVVTYEIFANYLKVKNQKAFQKLRKSLSTTKPSISELELLFSSIKEILLKINFLDPKNPKSAMPRIRQIINRSNIDKKDLDLLRGIVNALDNFANIDETNEVSHENWE